MAGDAASLQDRGEDQGAPPAVIGEVGQQQGKVYLRPFRALAPVAIHRPDDAPHDAAPVPASRAESCSHSGAATDVESPHLGGRGRASGGATSMASAPTSGRDGDLAKAQARYQYLIRAENQIAPIAMAKSWPWLAEQYGPSWILPFLPNFLFAQARNLTQRLRCGLQRATFRFDKLDAYNQLFSGPLPSFARGWEESTDDEHDAAFAWWRIAGANPLLLRREDDVRSLCRRIPLAVERIEARLSQRLGRPVSLDEEARCGRLFAADFRLILSALQWEQPEAKRDSRWREKYLAAPIGVFLEAPSFYPASALVPLAIQIDHAQPAPEHNPVYYPDDGWGWRVAKAYLETSDVTWQAAFGHVYRTHLVMEPFCMATPRQLSPRHPVRVLLQPHTRFTLTANQAAYKYIIERSELYNEIYAATLEQLREVAIQGYLETGFLDLQLEADLALRGVQDSLALYPYRDDLRLWLEPIRDFVQAYVEACYADDAAVQADGELRSWKEELTDPVRGAVRKLVPDERLDTRQKLVDLLAQLLFTAGPGHASQHYSANYYYRYAPAFPAGTYAPPPLANDAIDFARWLPMLPPIDAASDQFRDNTYTNYKYDRFGSYRRFPLGSVPQARAPIERLQAALTGIERTIEERQQGRLFPYEFVLPSRVPNSVNI